MIKGVRSGFHESSLAVDCIFAPHPGVNGHQIQTFFFSKLSRGLFVHNQHPRNGVLISNHRNKAYNKYTIWIHQPKPVIN